MTVKERVMGMRRFEESKTVTYGNGFVIENVPHEKRIENIDEEEFVRYIIKGKVSLILSVITEYMRLSGLRKFDYNNYSDCEPVKNLLQEYMNKYNLS